MKFTVADLLDQVPAEGSLEKAKLEKILRLTNRSEKQTLDLALHGLNRLGILTIDEEEGSVAANPMTSSKRAFAAAAKGFASRSATTVETTSTFATTS